jgi:hypothetical protein
VAVCTFSGWGTAILKSQQCKRFFCSFVQIGCWGRTSVLSNEQGAISLGLKRLQRGDVINIPWSSPSTPTYIFIELCLITHRDCFNLSHCKSKERDSSFGIATRYGLGRSGDRIPVVEIFSAPVQTGPGAHPTSYTMGTESFPGVKRPGRGVDHPPPSSAEVKERVELRLYSHSVPS